MKPFIKIIFILFIVLFITNNSFAGEWVDDWLTQKTVTGPSSFTGQKRNYYTAGGLSARWSPGVSEPLISVSPPKVKMGCGGIDVFLGGFNFMQFEYLVQKFQRMLQNAPAIAFDLALNTLCEPCTKAISKMEDIVNSLNGLQFDECKASKVMVAKAFSAFSGDGRVTAEANKDFELTQGIRTIGHNITEIWNSDGKNPQQDENTLTSGCPQAIKDIFITNGTLLNNISSKVNYPQVYVELIRGLVGDIKLESTTNSSGKIYIKPSEIFQCYENTGGIISSLVNNEIFYQDANENCTQRAGTGGIQGWVSANLQDIKSAMESKGTITPEQSSFIGNIQTPIYASMKVDVIAGDTIVTENFSDIAAKAFAYKMFVDIRRDMIALIERTKLFIQKQGEESDTCKVELLSGTVEYMNGLKDHIESISKDTYGDYMASVKDLNNIQQQANKLTEFDSIAREKFSKILSDSAINRALSR